MSDDLRALALAATPGPWAYREEGRAISVVGPPKQEGWIARAILVQASIKADSVRADEGRAIAAYIAAVHPQAILALLDSNKRMREALEAFAKAAEAMDEFDRRVGNERRDDEAASAFGFVPFEHQPTVGELRRARAALAPETEGGPGA